MDMNYRIVIEFKDFSDEVKHVATILSDYALSRKLIVKLKDTKMEIEGSGLPSDFSYVGNIITSLKKQPLFYKNAKKWIFYDMDNNAEDLLERYHLR